MRLDARLEPDARKQVGDRTPNIGRRICAVVREAIAGYPVQLPWSPPVDRRA